MLDEYGTTISALRVSAVEYTMSVIENAMRPPDARLDLVVGRVQAVKPTASGHLAVTIATPRDAQSPADTRVIEADLVVSNFAREPDYSRVRQPLWRNLLAKGLAVPHERTGRGVEVDEHGTLLGTGGEPIGPVLAVGVLREGDEIVRNGRTGAFAFNLATIKNQSIAVAARAIEFLDPQEPMGLADTGHSETDAANLGTFGQADQTGFEEAVVLEVKRMATRARSERELIGARLDVHIRSLGGAHAAADPSRRERLVRAAVNRAAVERLTDVSVTPRQLRRQLGLTGIEHPEG